MKVLALCRPAAGVDVAALGLHLTAEQVALKHLHASGTLLEAYTPGVPGAVLILNAVDLDEAAAVLNNLPLKAAGLIDITLTPLHPLDLDTG